MPGGLVRAPLTTFRLLLLSQRSHLEPRSFKRLMSVIEGKTVSSFLLFFDPVPEAFFAQELSYCPCAVGWWLERRWHFWAGWRPKSG